ncbi:sugar phosphate nucleotidyltransferase [Candidatus Pelagibacter bacterium nBUS_49]|uniref:sugar phosphate nucleotidyltransferase n=1 Tax=Candidatus Pelagibacter bacterium nBUS_49 TaxID=3374196 RepID=UPI003EBAECD3
MCGGFGKRLKPITIKIPKALVPINNNPMVSILMSNMKRFGFNRFILSTFYKSNLIKNYYKKDKSLNVKIEYLTEKKPLGTAGSLSLLKNRIKEKNFLVTNCDVLSEINYRSLLNFHIENNADFTMAIKRHYTESQFGEIYTSGINVKSITEKPIKNITINAGIYVIKTKLIKYLTLNKHLNMNELILELIKKNKKVIAFPFYENWFDLGTKKHIKVFKQN